MDQAGISQKSALSAPGSDFLEKIQKAEARRAMEENKGKTSAGQNVEMLPACMERSQRQRLPGGPDSSSPSRSPSPGLEGKRSRSRSPFREEPSQPARRHRLRRRRIRNLGKGFTATKITDYKQVATEIAERSRGILKGLENMQHALRWAGGPFTKVALLATSMLPGNIGEMARFIRPLMVDRNTAVIVDVREVLSILFSFRDDEIKELMCWRPEFAIRLSSRDIRIINYNDVIRDKTPQEIREDYKNVQDGEVSKFGMHYSSAPVCKREEVLSMFLEILIQYSDPKYVDFALAGDTESLALDFGVTTKVTLICIRQSLEMLIHDGKDVYWEIWPGNKEKWPFSKAETPDAVLCLQKYFTLLINGDFKTAESHYQEMELMEGMQALSMFTRATEKSDTQDDVPMDS